MVGIYINGNGKHQHIMNRMVSSAHELNLSKTSLQDWITKIERYNRFYMDGDVSRQLETTAIRRYGQVGTKEMAVATYIEEDMDLFLEKIQRILNR